MRGKIAKVIRRHARNMYTSPKAYRKVYQAMKAEYKREKRLDVYPWYQKAGIIPQ